MTTVLQLTHFESEIRVVPSLSHLYVICCDMTVASDVSIVAIQLSIFGDGLVQANDSG